MRITKADFITSIDRLKPFLGDGLPQIAMAGRSNVGKSSLINSLCNNRRLARASAEPGKTRTINLYRVNDAFILADLPGYGFAKASGEERRRWSGMMESYLTGSKSLLHVLLLVDIRREPEDSDREMVDYLRHYDLPFTVVCTKADKLSRAQQSRNLPAIGRKLIVQPWQLLSYSAETHQGREELLQRLDAILHPAAPQDSGIVLPENISFDDGPTREVEEEN